MAAITPVFPIGRKRAPYSTKACDSCKKRRLRCQADPGQEGCARCISKGLVCSAGGKAGGAKPAHQSASALISTSSSSSSSSSSSRSPPSSSSSPEAFPRELQMPVIKPILELAQLTQKQVSFAFSFHLLNVHKSTAAPVVPNECWVYFKAAFLRTGTLSNASQRLVYYIQWLKEDDTPQRRMARVSRTASQSILTSLEQRVIDKIEELKLEDKSFEEQEEAMSLMLSAIDTIDVAEATWRHRLYGISFKPVLLLSAAESSPSKKYQRTLDFAKALAINDILFSTAYGISPRTTTSEYTYLFGQNPSNLLPSFHFLTPTDLRTIFASAPLTPSVLTLLWTLLLPPLESLLHQISHIFLFSFASDPSKSVFAIWDLASLALSYIDRICQGLRDDPRTKEQEALSRPGRLQLVLRTLIDVEIKFVWTLLAVHAQLKLAAEEGKLVGEVEEWMVLSRVRLRACVDRLGKRSAALLALSMRPGHLSRLIQFLGHTLEVIGRVYAASPARFLAGDGPNSGAIVKALRFAEEQADDQSLPKPKLGFIANELEVAMGRMTLEPRADDPPDNVLPFPCPGSDDMAKRMVESVVKEVLA
ncbi:hypothetical protein BCR35DRAFT_327081 [Leucosporidium creatinivorum]|uniref:Zn(2)-C6 fungal-type domain-containing protein n=1 Tax=Leucosporidium creatinivorum TaxID=106004 RepID=A0A1Y2D7B7_9BASI|nr:hypothetical protein BCR35DRAFT_327081 [Leucosporidium creatinivorum]